MKNADILFALAIWVAMSFAASVVFGMVVRRMKAPSEQIDIAGHGHRAVSWVSLILAAGMLAAAIANRIAY